MVQDADDVHPGKVLSLDDSQATGQNLWNKPSRKSQSHAQWEAVHKRSVFLDHENMKEKVKIALLKDNFNIQDLYHETGMMQKIATSNIFEQVTLAIIGINSIWIAWETDNNNAEFLVFAAPGIQAMEHLFCIYFSVELLIRFAAFRYKRDIRKDAWFLFDSILVVLMVAETWVLSILVISFGSANMGSSGLGNASVLRVVRLLRLTRMARMFRLLRALPELMILIKGMAAATRSVFFTLCLLIITMYIFGIALTQLTSGTPEGNTYFSTVPASMYTLLLRGTFLDNITEFVSDISAANPLATVIFFLFVLLGALTVMNMLIGVLCEVVSAVAAVEREEMLLIHAKGKVQTVLQEIDDDGDEMINKDEFQKILSSPQACIALQDVGVDVVGLVDLADIIFETNDGGEQKALDFAEFMDVILDLRGSKTATVKDIVNLRKQINASKIATERLITQVQEQISEFKAEMLEQFAVKFLDNVVDDFSSDSDNQDTDIDRGIQTSPIALAKENMMRAMQMRSPKKIGSTDLLGGPLIQQTILEFTADKRSTTTPKLKRQRTRFQEGESCSPKHREEDELTIANKKDKQACRVSFRSKSTKSNSIEDIEEMNFTAVRSANHLQRKPRDKQTMQHSSKVVVLPIATADAAAGMAGSGLSMSKVGVPMDADAPASNTFSSLRNVGQVKSKEHLQKDKFEVSPPSLKVCQMSPQPPSPSRIPELQLTAPSKGAGQVFDEPSVATNGDSDSAYIQQAAVYSILSARSAESC